MAEDSSDVKDEENGLACEWKYDGSARFPIARDENGEGRTVLKSGAQRTHRVLGRDEFKQNKAARWFELEVHGSVRVLSKDIFDMRHLTALFASHNLLRSLPSEISQLHHLSILDVSNNQLTSIPREIGDMTGLLHLNLADNQLSNLPPELGKLYKIKTLNIAGNPLPSEYLSFGNTPQGSRNLQQHLLDSLAKTIPKPPPRDWFTIKTLSNNGKPVAQFKVLCYNVLCDTYATPSLYSYCPLWALHWEYRKNIIMKEILNYDADIIGLHEVEAEQFRVFYEPELKKRGYDGIFSPKSRAKTMSTDNRKHVDGCSLFWKNKKFRLSKQHLAEFAQIAINKAHQSDAIINRVMPKDNIALLATMEILSGIYVDPGQHPLNVKKDSASGDIDGEDNIVGTPLVLCAAHTHWDPEYCDVKLIQSMMLIHECAKQIENAAKDFSLPLEEVPLIVCGDFNSLPESGVVHYLINGSVPKDHPDLKSFCHNMVLNGINTNEYEDVHYSHSLKLESSIDPNEGIHTNVTPDFKGMIDYILTTPHSLDRVGYLGGIWQNWIRDNGLAGFPHPHVPSDHIPIMASYILKPRHQRSPARECLRFRRNSESFKLDMDARKK